MGGDAIVAQSFDILVSKFLFKIIKYHIKNNTEIPY